MAEAIELKGYILDFEDAALDLPIGTGQEYVAHNERLLIDPFQRHADRQRIKAQRDNFAAPIEIGSFAPSREKSVSHDAFIIKASGSYTVHIPKAEAYAVSVADIIAKDLLELYGAEGFKKANLLLLNKQSVVPTQQAQMNDKGFDSWHDHATKTRHPADIIYTFHTVLPTEIKHGDSIVAPHENTICRMGGEILHRSKKNVGPPVARQFGAILVEREENYAFRMLPSNPVMQGDKTLDKEFRRAANRVLQESYRSRAYSDPVRLRETEYAL